MSDSLYIEFGHKEHNIKMTIIMAEFTFNEQGSDVAHIPQNDGAIGNPVVRIVTWLIGNVYAIKVPGWGEQLAPCSLGK